MLEEKYIEFDVDVSNKEQLLKYIASMGRKLDLVNDRDVLYQDLINREKEFSTGLADGFAIPHARTNNVKKTAILFIKTINPIDWGSLDDGLANYFFVLLVPSECDGNKHLQMISKLATCLLEDEFKDKIKLSKNKAELKKYILQEMRED